MARFVKKEDQAPKVRGFERVTGYEDAVIPTRGTEFSAGYDLCSARNIDLMPKTVTYVATGLKVYMPDDEYLNVSLRSGFANRYEVFMPNSPSVIDADYYNNESNEGHMVVPIYNTNGIVIPIQKGERIAQGVFLKYLLADGDEAGGKRTGGFGSTGS